MRRIEEHPLKQLFDLGVRVTVNSDDPEVLDTNLNNEYRIAHEVLGMSFEDLAALQPLRLRGLLHSGACSPGDLGPALRNAA